MNFTPFEQNKALIAPQKREIPNAPQTPEAEARFQELMDIQNAASSLQVGKGVMIRHFLSTVELRVDPYDLFADIMDLSVTPRQIRRRRYSLNRPQKTEARRLAQRGVLFAHGDFGHTSPNWDPVFELGIPGLRQRALDNLEKEGLTQEQKDFYTSVVYAYDGVLIYMQRLEKLALEADTPNSRFAAENLRELMLHAPETLGQAMQLYVTFYSAQHFADDGDLRTLGCVDRQLYPFYKKHLEQGGTEEEVREMLRYFFYKWSLMEIGANIPFHLADVPNELTWIMLEEYKALHIYDPKIHIKVSDRTPEKLLMTVMQSIKEGSSSFVFVNEAAVLQALTDYGIDAADAADYTIVGCYEPAANGTELPCSCNGNINLPAAVESVLNGGKMLMAEDALGKAYTDDQLKDFGSFYAAFLEQVKAWCDMAVAEVTATEEKYPIMVQAPVLSSTYASCMEKGKDIYAGGAKYNSSSLCGIGIATAADALIAIKKGVYEDKIVTLPQLREVLKNNWEGHDALRRKMQDYPKYGNNQPEVDELACEISNFTASCINGRPNGHGGTFRFGTLSIDWNIKYAKVLGASADGRLAGMPMSKNLAPTAGMDRKGVTGVIHTVKKLDFSQMPNGTVLDLNFHPTVVSDEGGIMAVLALLKTFFNGGGMAMQLNMVDPDTLRAAQRDPEKYRNLQVRVCGWNEYFVDMSLAAQNEMIHHTEMMV